MTKILITGSSGFIGSHLMKRLDAFGLDYKDGQDILTCDLPDADIIIHLAAHASVIESMNDPVGDARINILGTIRLANHYKDKRFIFASSGGAIQEVIESPYGMSKLCAEKYIDLLCEDYVILRFPNIYGPGSHSVVEGFINGPIRIYGDGTSTRDYVHVDDLVEAIAQSLEWKKGLYSLGSEINTSILDLAQATGKPIEFVGKVKGELQATTVPNTTPNWRPKTKVLEYIKECMTSQS